MKKKIIYILFVFSYYFGLNRLFSCFTRKRQRVITFHNVIPDHLFDNSIHLGVSCSESVFIFQLDEINKRLNITTQINVSNTAVITFDDGYFNNYKYANRILNEKGLDAIFFITYNLIDKQQILWIDKLLLWFSYAPNGRYKVLELDILITGNNRGFQYMKSYQYILKNYDKKDKLIIELNNIYSFDSLNISPDLFNLRFCPLSIDQIAEMKQNNHLIALHSVNHDILSSLNNIDLDLEIKTSESLYSSFYNCNYFSYPFGGEKEVNDFVVKSFESSFFEKCFTNKWTWNIHTSNYQIQRMSLPNTKDKYIINAHLSGFYFFLKHIFNV
tara:strand:- start:152 stop:1138 length:987 start_codon:yes stop_codon:yes gene_type:complete